MKQQRYNNIQKLLGYYYPPSRLILIIQNSNKGLEQPTLKVKFVRCYLMYLYCYTESKV